jgi:hypothetical protein
VRLREPLQQTKRPASPNAWLSLLIPPPERFPK